MNNYSRGVKRTCPHCELKFFDMNREKLECPRCKNEIIIEALMRKTPASKNAALHINKKEEQSLDTKYIEEDMENIEDDDINDEDDNSTIVNIDE